MEVSMAVAITRKDRTAGELRAVGSKCKDAKAALRMLAIAMVLEGYDRKTAAEVCGMDRQPCVIGCIAITPKGSRVCQTGDQEAGRPG